MESSNILTSSLLPNEVAYVNTYVFMILYI
uniref:Uncharacterized protein n=1 Tax=Siphoviridae sp. ctbrg2 TaxID=2823589 RepID=A0A8S5LFN9_9CAUD|nr:MAG TPA: hypothetical protein [Siphoviridae sp. ctbrg2]